MESVACRLRSDEPELDFEIFLSERRDLTDTRKDDLFLGLSV